MFLFSIVEDGVKLVMLLSSLNTYADFFKDKIPPKDEMK